MSWYTTLLTSPIYETVTLTGILTISIFLIVKNTGILTTPKQLSWLIATLQAFVLTLASLPQIYLLATNSFDLAILTPSSQFSIVILTLFTTTLTFDLILGVLYYPQYIQFLTGWFHHTVYFIINYILLVNDLAGHFLLLCPLEIPTMILGLGQLNKSLRSDFYFGLSYFLTRIVYHFTLMVYFFLYDEKLLSGMVLLCIYPLHLFWFRGFILQQRRIKKKLANKNLNLNGATNLTDTMTTLSDKKGDVDAGKGLLNETSPLLNPLELDCKYSVEAVLPSPILLNQDNLDDQVNPLDVRQ